MPKDPSKKQMAYLLSDDGPLTEDQKRRLKAEVEKTKAMKAKKKKKPYEY